MHSVRKFWPRRHRGPAQQSLTLLFHSFVRATSTTPVENRATPASMTQLTRCSKCGHDVGAVRHNNHLHHFSTALFGRHPQPLWKTSCGHTRTAHFFSTMVQVSDGKAPNAAFPQAYPEHIHICCGKRASGAFVHREAAMRISTSARRDGFAIKDISHLSTGFSRTHPHVLWKTFTQTKTAPRGRCFRRHR